MLPRIFQRWNKISEITLVTSVLASDEAPTAQVHHDRIARATDAKLMQARLHLGREAEEGGGAAVVPNQHSQFIKDFFSTETSESRALIGPSDNFGEVVVQEFRELGDTMANDIMKQFSRQSTHPMG